MVARKAPTQWAMLLVVLVALGVGCGGTKKEEERAPSTGWLVLLCRASDNATEPHQKAFYERYFRRSEPDLLYDYFDAVSGGTTDSLGRRVPGKVDVSLSKVYGWFEMSVDTATLRSRPHPGVDRTQTARDCTKAGLAQINKNGTVEKAEWYAGVITVINVPVDSGATSERSVVVNNVESPVAGPSFLEHEMLHVLGLRQPRNGHSWLAAADFGADHHWNHGLDMEYNDCWDMMSFYTCVYTFPTAQGLGPQGPELQGEYRMKLGWMPIDRVSTLKASDYNPSRQLELAPLSNPEKPGLLLARIEVPGKGFYAVEYRKPSRFDRGIPTEAVVIREVRQDTVTYLVMRSNGWIGWDQGETFTDRINHIAISVNSIRPSGATITVKRVN
jgi:hypothetical protein